MLIARAFYRRSLSLFTEPYSTLCNHQFCKCVRHQSRHTHQVSFNLLFIDLNECEARAFALFWDFVVFETPTLS
jgi:hypothetical protein